MERKTKKTKKIIPLPQRELPLISHDRMGGGEMQQAPPNPDQQDIYENLRKKRIRIILPNYGYEEPHLFFKFQDTKPVKCILQKRTQTGYIEVKINRVFIEDLIYRIEYEWEKVQDDRGLRCVITIDREDLLYYEDFQKIGKLIEIDLMNMHKNKYYDTLDIDQYIEDRIIEKSSFEISNEVE